MQLILQLTRQCNFACTYCYQTHRPGKGMSLEVARAAVQGLLDQGHDHVALTYFGGEPLLEREMIVASLPALRVLGTEQGALVTAKICTNGSLLDEAFCVFAREQALFVSLSTDGHPEAQDQGRRTREGGASSATIERALCLLRASGTPFATYQVITPENAHLLAKGTDWLWERGARLFVSTLDYGADWREEHLAALQESYRKLARRYMQWKKRGYRFFLAPFDSKLQAHTRPGEFRRESCSAGVRQLAVDPDGLLYPCIEFLEDQAFAIGHVDRGLDLEAFKKLNQEHAGERPIDCTDCGIRARCGSNCACLNLRTGNKMRAVDELLCTHERLVTLAADEIGARLWKKKTRAFLDTQYNPHHHVLHTLEQLTRAEP